jgi:hypothetical protein
MRKLHQVEEAEALMTEAMAWSVMKWLREKKRVRKIADIANAALDELERTVKARWNPDVSSAYNELARQTGTAEANARSQAGPNKSQTINPDMMRFVRQVKELDDQAHAAHMDAEHTFDEAERLLSTSLAREGCRKAIRSWELHEKAIRRAEA